MDCASKQDFSDPWEFIIVDSAYEERKELVAAYWKLLGSPAPLIHIPPLDPLPSRQTRHAWDIPLYLNTGWAHAEGEVCVHIEDYMYFRGDWLRNHVEFIHQHPNLVSIGHTMADLIFDDNAPGHYGRKNAVELREEMGAHINEAFEKPDQYICLNFNSYGSWLSGNTGVLTKHILKINGASEWPTHHPERWIAPDFFDCGLTMWPLESTPAWHASHTIYPIIGYIMKVSESLTHQGIMPEYQPVDLQHFRDIPEAHKGKDYYRRNLREERIRLGKWVLDG